MCTHRERYVRGFLMSLFPILLYGNKNKLSPCDAGRPHWKQEQDVVFLYHYLEVLCCLRKFIEAKCKRWAVWSKMQRLWCQGRVRTTEKTAWTSQEFWAKLPLGRRVPELWYSQHWSWKGQKYWEGWLCPPLGCLSGYNSCLCSHLHVVNLKNMCVQSMHRYWEPIPNSKIQGQGTMEILEYHLFHHVCMTDRSSMSRVVQKSSRLNIWLLAASGLGRCLQTP